MKILIVSLAVFFLGVSNCLGQAFHYDTIPAPKKNQEQPVQQQATYQRKPAQQAEYINEESSPKGRMVFGGSFGMAFGSGYSSINISPQVGYEFNRYFTAGGGIGYFYYKNDYTSLGNRYKYSQNYLGLNIYGKVNPIPLISLQVQPELYGMWGSVGGESLDSQVVPCVLVGGGLNIPAGERGAISAMVYYDVVQNEWSPYGDQLFYSIGYTFRF